MDHVLHRGNGRMRIFHKAEDYEALERVLAVLDPDMAETWVRETVARVGLDFTLQGAGRLRREAENQVPRFIFSSVGLPRLDRSKRYQ